MHAFYLVRLFLKCKSFKEALPATMFEFVGPLIGGPRFTVRFDWDHTIWRGGWGTHKMDYLDRESVRWISIKDNTIGPVSGEPDR